MATTDWIVRECSIKGCGVRIRERLADHAQLPICKWHQAGHAYIQRAITTHPDAGPYIGREEFGLDLYEAIKLQSAMRQEEANAVMYQRKSLQGRAREATAKAKDLAARLQLVLAKNTIEPSELKRLLAIT